METQINKNKDGFTYEMHIMTMVDLVTGWFEQQQLYGTPTAYRCQEILDNVWLTRYPRPREIDFNNGGELKDQPWPALNYHYQFVKKLTTG